MPTDTVASPRPSSESAAPRPWWRHGMVWFMLSGPAIVVVAGFATLAIAVRHADVELGTSTTPTALAVHALQPKH